MRFKGFHSAETHCIIKDVRPFIPPIIPAPFISHPLSSENSVTSDVVNILLLDCQFLINLKPNLFENIISENSPGKLVFLFKDILTLCGLPTLFVS